MQWNKVCDKLGFDNHNLYRELNGDLLKRLKISEQQYGVGMEDNPFQDMSNDEAMVCFGGGGKITSSSSSVNSYTTNK